MKYDWRKIFSSKLVSLSKFFEKKSNHIWYDYPFGKKPIGSKNQYLDLAKEVSKKTYLEINNFEQKTGFAIDRVWLDDLALHTQVVIKDSPLCYAHGRILFSALCYYIKNKQLNNISIPAINIWETGTARGFSSICMAKALSELNQPGKIVTFDVLPHNQKMYWNCIDDLDGPKTRSDLLKKWNDLVTNYIFFHQGDTKIELPKIKTERIHFAFLDAEHNYDGVMYEFLEIYEKQEAGDMIIYDDYTPDKYPELVNTVDEICEVYKYNTDKIKAHNERGYLLATKL